VILLTCLIAFVAIKRFSDLKFITGGLAQHEVPEIHLLWRIQTMISGMEVDLNQFLSHGREEHLVALQEAIGSLGKTLASYQALHRLQAGPEEQLLRDLTSDYQLLQEATVQIIDVISTGEEEKARVNLRGKWYELHQRTVESLDRYFDYEDRVTLFPNSGHTGYVAQAPLACAISSNFAGLMSPIVECRRIRL
ncbi:MAG: hypothetical protein ACE5F1_19470, partial [Planctomycetota bacterium]